VREIKFRAWHKSRNEFVPVSAHFDFDQEGVVYQTDFKPIELMMSTGLKDKNGKEIYEGDVLWAKAYPNARYLRKGVVYYDDGSFNVKLQGRKRRLFLLLNNCEVIGNIYENPELLVTKEKIL
jgi:uncharacterized phage protein (TIGR01671 family)